MRLLDSFFKRAPRSPGREQADAEHKLEEGMYQEREGHLDAALLCYDEAIALAPSLARAHFNRGNILLDRGDVTQALPSYRKAIELKPDSAAAHYNLGNAHLQLGNLEASVSALRTAVTLKPDFPDAHISLGLVHGKLGNEDEARLSFARAAELDSDGAQTHYRIAVCWQEAGFAQRAIDSLQKTLALQPDHLDAQLCTGVALKDLGDVAGALAYVQRALEIQPDYVLAHSNLLFIQNYLAEQASEQLLTDARCFGKAAAHLARPFSEWPKSPDPQRPLRVGLVSGDLGNHPVGYFLEGVLARLAAQAGDRLAFFAYSHRLDEDATSQRLRLCCQGWLTTIGLTDEALARRVRDDGIDILIDLAGHTASNRLVMFAWKPAPVQVSWLGYFATTGLAAMDYFLADPWTLPPEQEAYFTEQVWRLPETRLCFTPPDSKVEVNALPALTTGYITFGCFNNLSKMNDAVVQLWARVLHAVPGSQLFLKYGQLADASVRQRTCERFAAHGIASERLVLEGHSPRGDYLAAYQRVDIALDPFPFPGGTTTMEALWMGVPVLTLQGERFLARQGVGLLMNAGLPEWVAVDAEDYVARAVAHARDLQALAALRARLRQQVLASPIYDAPRFAQHFEAALRSMWQRWCEQHDRG